jgi:hypothetical protein
MPLYMRVSKLRGSNKKMSMPMGPFRTHTLPVNVEELSRFEAGTEVTPELLQQAGVLRHLRHPVKVLGRGELTVKLNVVVHAVSESAKAKIEAAGGTVTLIEGPKPHGRELAKLEKAAARAAGGSAAKAAAAPVAEASADADDDSSSSSSEDSSEG